MKKSRITYSLALAIFFLAGLTAKAQVRHVILISIDSFNPGMYLDKDWPCPNLRFLVKNGTYADHLKSVFPSFTYPSHTAMVTGALPARSKIRYNQPIGSKGEWYWYYKDIKAPTLWQALKDNNKTTASLMWPVTVGAPIDHNLSELWDIDHSSDRITVARKAATPGLVEELEANATGKLDGLNMNDGYFSLDENVGRMAAYVIGKYKPDFLALHVIGADDFGHNFGRDADSVKFAMGVNDRVIGNVLEAVQKAGIKDSTAIIIVGDHGMASIKQVMRPNLLIQNIPAQFVPAGGAVFLYRYADTKKEEIPNIVKAVTDSLNKLPKEKRDLFRIINRKELDQMGADSAVVLALSGINASGLVFSGATTAAKTNIAKGPGTSIQQSKYEGAFYPTKGGHHGYDPNNPEMYTGFIAYGAGINRGGHITELSEPDIAVLIAKLLNIDFKTPDGKYIPGIIK